MEDPGLTAFEFGRRGRAASPINGITRLPSIDPAPGFWLVKSSVFLSQFLGSNTTDSYGEHRLGRFSVIRVIYTVPISLEAKDLILPGIAQA
jgi:hypothetical protein